MRRALLLVPTVLALILANIFTPLTALAATTWNKGDVFVGISGGKYNVYDNSGTFKQTIGNTAGGFTTGCAFDHTTAANFYGTYFTASRVIKFDGNDPHSSSGFGSGFGTPESIVFDKDGNVYVGNIINGIRKYDKDGNFIKTVIATRVDWLDISADQDTILYTQEGNDIKRVSAATGMSLSNFTTGTASRAFALRILPNGDVLLADNGNVKRYNSLGQVMQTYAVMGEGTWFSLNRDPNGTSFWSGNYGSANFYRINIVTGAVEVGPINTGTGSSTLFGICLKGELTVVEGKITLTPKTAQNEAGTSHTVTARVTDGSASAGVLVSFRVTSGPNMDATGTCSADAGCRTDANGQVSFTYTSNGTGGTDTIQACFTDMQGKQHCDTATKTWIVVEQPITAQGTTFSATEGKSFTATVATFTDPDPKSTAAEYSATIAWGDSTPTMAGSVSGPVGGPFRVSGTHIYAEEGTYKVAVTITDVDTASNNATAFSTANVVDAALTASPACSTTSLQSYNGPTATFTDAASPFGTLSDFSATIDWGDSSSSTGTVTGLNGGPYTVSGSHTYASTGTFTITTNIKDVGSSTASTSCKTLVFAFAPGGGSFVIGDQNSANGTAVTFWGAQWAKENSLSGGAAPHSFKGFAENPNTPSCGIDWSADPGNSTPPPDGPLPAFMAVIVTSSADKSGSTISGNTVQIVVVKTDPGYEPNPGHAGTGTVVAVVC